MIRKGDVHRPKEIMAQSNEQGMNTFDSGIALEDHAPGQ